MGLVLESRYRNRGVIMNMYYIGIIDEDMDEVLDIKRTILVNKPVSISEDQIQFVDYSFPSDTATFSQVISDAVIEDIKNSKIHVLIVDYRIIIESTLIDGTEIFNKISSFVPKFPMLILTNVPDDCYKSFVDADKVYSKRSFFKIEENYSIEKTLNIFRNIDNYKKHCASLTATLDEQLLKLEGQGYTPDVFQRILSLEKALGDYLPQEQSMVEKELNISELKEAVILLKEANHLLDGENGTGNED